jgi:hypothetical protein
MASFAFWMADHVCPLLAYFGVHACTTTTNLHLVGVAGCIFSGVALLMLMGISDHFANLWAARINNLSRSGRAAIGEAWPDSTLHGAAQPRT